MIVIRNTMYISSQASIYWEEARPRAGGIEVKHPSFEIPLMMLKLLRII